MLDTADSAQKQQQQLLQDAMHKEWAALQRRYHAQQILDASSTDEQPQSAALSTTMPATSNNDDSGINRPAPPMRARCFVSLSDPDLSEQFKGETELQFELPAQYPAQEPIFDLSCFRSRLSAEQFAAIDAAMKTRARELRGTLSLRKMLTWLDNNFYPLLQLAATANTTDVPRDDAVHVPTLAYETTFASSSVERPTQAIESSSALEADTSTSGLALRSDATPAQVAPAQTASQKKTRRRKEKKDPSDTPCRYFLRQSCKSGDVCKFSHALAPVQSVVENESAPAAGVGANDDSASIKVPPAPDSSALLSSLSMAARSTTSSKKNTRRESMPTEQPGASAAASAKPAKTRAKKPRACKFFAANKCREGDRCKFLHEVKETDASASTAATGQEPPHSEQSKPKGIVIKVLKAAHAPASIANGTKNADNAERVDSATTPSTSAPSTSDSESWSEAQQKSLDAALKKYPASLDKKIRWLSIASEVDGKSLNDCIDRYKLLSKMVCNAQPHDDTAAGERTQESAHAADQVEPSGERSSGIDKRIIAVDKRTAIETEPEERGAQIRLDELFLHQIGTLVPHRLVCQVQCSNCPLKFDATLALDSASVRKWCPRCSVLHLVSMRAVFAHASSAVVAYVDTNENCRVVDVVPSELLATCLECGGEVLFPSVTPMRRAEHACFTCHTKLALLTRRYVVGQFASASSTLKVKSSGASTSQSLPSAKSKSKSNTGGAKRVVENFVLGQPLPNRGACEHYRHSLRWFRFQCCGKAFPCDVCHDASDCAEANMGKIASRMICGLCSKEQPSSVKVCACGNEVGKKKVVTAHWEGGTGCRDTTRMAHTDRKKFRGLTKTVSKKQNRVGVMAKMVRGGGGAQT